LVEGREFEFIRNKQATGVFGMGWSRSKLLFLPLLLQHSTRGICGFALPRRPSASIVVAPGTREVQLLAKARNIDASSDDDIDGMADSTLYENLRNRIQELGLDERDAIVKGVEADEGKEYVYIGGERFYLPPPSSSSSPSSSRPASMVDQGKRSKGYWASPSGYDPPNTAVSSRRELLDEARPSIIGSLEGLALAISLFFVVTVAASGGSLFASNVNVSTGSMASQRVIFDPDTLLKEDFARDGSSIFYGQTSEE